jgi:hypothetical protein
LGGRIGERGVGDQADAAVSQPNEMTDSFVSTANVINVNKGDGAIRQVAVEDKGKESISALSSLS